MTQPKASAKTWKDHLLSSGLPLEHDVKRVLQEFNVFQPAEYHYRRQNEFGQVTEFSVDFHGPVMDVDQMRYWVDVFVECKYRHNGIRWVFTPDSDTSGSVGIPNLLVDVDCRSDWAIDYKTVRTIPSNYPLCEKGVELLPDGPNPKSIRQAVDQLRYAYPHFLSDAVIHQFQRLLGRTSPVFAFLPIVITTAELWRLIDDISLVEIRTAETLDKVARRVPLLILHENTSNELDSHNISVVRGKLSEQDIPEDIVESALRYTWHRPTYFGVVELSHLRTVMQDLTTVLVHKDVFQPKQRPEGMDVLSGTGESA